MPCRLDFAAMRFRYLGAVVSLAATGMWWSVGSTGVESNLRGVSVIVDATFTEKTTIWVSGSKGAILRSVDAGKHWGRVSVPAGDSLDFRGVVGIDRNSAYLMSSGEAEKSRIYKTRDGGKTWQLQYTDRRKAFFLDALACTDDGHCFALSDPIDGKFLLLRTEDGEHWAEMAREHMPEALAKEGAFAASNSSLIVNEHELYFATGGGAHARVFHSPDLGKTWTVSETPVVSGKTSAGIFSLACHGRHLVAVGGDFEEPTRAFGSAAVSDDGGETWRLAVVPPGGYRSAVGKYARGYVAVGPSGTEISADGLRWEPTDVVNLNAVGFADGQVWAVGPKGSVARFLDHTQQRIENLGPLGFLGR
jgi:photosystem II stability/assembly factor-like uncharacterized protein